MLQNLNGLVQAELVPVEFHSVDVDQCEFPDISLAVVHDVPGVVVIEVYAVIVHVERVFCKRYQYIGLVLNIKFFDILDQIV